MTPLKRLLFEKQIQLRKLAQLTGMTETSLSLIVNGKRLPNLVNAFRIAKALEVSLEDLWGYIMEEGELEKGPLE